MIFLSKSLRSGRRTLSQDGIWRIKKSIRTNTYSTSLMWLVFFKMDKTSFFTFLREYEERESWLFYAANSCKVSAVCTQILPAKLDVGVFSSGIQFPDVRFVVRRPEMVELFVCVSSVMEREPGDNILEINNLRVTCWAGILIALRGFSIQMTTPNLGRIDSSSQNWSCNWEF